MMMVVVDHRSKRIGLSFEYFSSESVSMVIKITRRKIIILKLQVTTIAIRIIMTIVKGIIRMRVIRVIRIRIR
jgi:hypothetical protein